MWSMNCHISRKLASMIDRFIPHVVTHVTMCCIQCRMSVEHVAQQVRELKKSLADMSKNIKKAPEDFRKQMENFLEVHVYYSDMFVSIVYFDIGGKQRH